MGANTQADTSSQWAGQWAIVISVSVAIWTCVVIATEVTAAELDGTSPWKTVINETGEWKPPHWCEAKDANLSVLIIESSNARSSYGYFLVGISMVVLSVADHWQNVQHGVYDAPMETVENFILRFPIITFSHGIYNFSHAVGTVWNHSCECEIGDKFDVAGMMAVVVLPLCTSIVPALEQLQNTYGAVLYWHLRCLLFFGSLCSWCSMTALHSS